MRDVALVITDPLHAEWVYAVKDSARTDCVDVRTRVANTGAVQKKCAVTTLIADSSGAIVASEEGSGGPSPRTPPLNSMPPSARFHPCAYGSPITPMYIRP